MSLLNLLLPMSDKKYLLAESAITQGLSKPNNEHKFLERFRELSNNLDIMNAKDIYNMLFIGSYSDQMIIQASDRIVALTNQIHYEYTCFMAIKVEYIARFYCDNMNLISDVYNILQSIDEKMKPFKRLLASFGVVQLNIINGNMSSFIPQDYSIDLPPTDEPIIFVLSQFRNCVTTLYRTIISMIVFVSYFIDECIDTMKKVSMLKTNATMCNDIFIGYLNHFVANNSYISNLVGDDTIDRLAKTNPAYRLYRESADELTFASQAYHKFSRECIDQLCLILFAHAKRAVDMSDTERALCGGDLATLAVIRDAVDHFDRLMPSDVRKPDIAMYIYYFYLWIDKSNLKTVHSYFAERYKGKYSVPTYVTVNNRRSSYQKGTDKERAFRERIESRERPH